MGVNRTMHLFLGECIWSVRLVNAFGNWIWVSSWLIRHVVMVDKGRGCILLGTMRLLIRDLLL